MYVCVYVRMYVCMHACIVLSVNTAKKRPVTFFESKARCNVKGREVPRTC